MPMTILTARDTGIDYLLRIHLDSTKFVPDPALPVPAEGEADTRPLVPDPVWVREFTFGKQPPPSRTAVQYLADIRREVKALCQGELARMQPVAPDAGTKLSIEGMEL